VRAIRAGRGDTTLFLLHGFGESLFTWRAVLDALAERYRVLAIDLPGFAGSEKPDSGYTLATMTDRLAQLLDRSAEGPVVAVGHSMGGELAAALALARPRRVVALVLVAPAGWSVGLGGIADTMYPSKARAIGWYLSSRAFLLPEHDPDWLGEPDSTAGYTLVGDPAYRNSAARVLEEFDFRGLRGQFGRLTQPTLLLWGTLDPVIPFAVGESVATAVPCSRLVALPNALHRPHVEIPDTVVAEIRRFLARPSC
jgi:pimeloyl-ACP methyl ester carboxylesterase